MSPGRPAADEQPITVEPELVGAIAQNAERLTNFSDDVGETGLRRQRVADDGDVDAVGARSVGEEGEHVLVVALPIAAVNEHEQRRPRRAAGEVIEARARPAAVGNTEARNSRQRASQSALSATAAPLL